MVILAVDVGAKRIGVAVSDELELLASPHDVIHRQSTAQALDAIARAVTQVGAELVVVGLPVSFDSQLHAQARTIQAFAAKLGRRLSVPVVLADETLSSVRAEEQLRAAGVRPERIRQRLDAAAAALILQDFLDQRRTARRSGAGASSVAATPTPAGSSTLSAPAGDEQSSGEQAGGETGQMGQMEDSQLP